MALVLIMAKLTPEAMQAWHAQGVANRAAEVSTAMEGLGAKLLSYYPTDGGEWDVVSIFDLPETWDAAARIKFLQRAYSAGAHVKLQHIYLTTPEALDAANLPQVRNVTDE